MRLFARIAFLCNVCFLVALVGRYVELFSTGFGLNDKVSVNPVVAVVLILYFLSILVNGAFGLIMLYLFVFRKAHNIPRWIVFCNLLILFIQIYYFLLT